MNREEALELLRGGAEGVQEWNWRREVGEAVPDLREVCLDDADLFGADLSETNFSEAFLVGASLRSADLWRAFFWGANLRGSNLHDAHLGDANLSYANLCEVDLSEADLIAAMFRGASFRHADFTNAKCLLTDFGDVDLSEVKGLETVYHTGPSTVGVDTLYKSKGKISVEFLRGCGVPERLIEYLPALVGSVEAIGIYSCFISYSTKDEDLAKRLYSRMRDEKLRVWFAPEDVKGGEKLHDQIDRAIRVYDKLLLVLSEHSMQSEWVKTEICEARQREIRENRRVLFPIRLVPFEMIREWKCFDADAGKDLAREIREYFIPDFSDWKNHDAFEKAFGRLLNDLTVEGRPEPRST